MSILFESSLMKAEELILRFFILRSYCRNHNFSLRHTISACFYNLFQ
ncbi:MAG: hypothetical protein JWO58_916 [Chitinophagaceae bacterium]|nr:hypothetical protein [Chitinophagaceae bacterium]